MLELTDEVALTQAVQGDAQAFGVLYERYVNRVFNYIYYRTGNIYDAEDLTERVFIRAMNPIVNYHNQGLPLSAWLYRIAHNLVANWHRDNSRRKEIPLDEGVLVRHDGEHPEHELLISEERERLLRVIRRLPAELFQEATVQSAVDFSRLQIVLVITNFRAINTVPLVPTPVFSDGGRYGPEHNMPRPGNEPLCIAKAVERAGHQGSFRGKS